ncbi:MAG: glycoside hydrolase family 88 protein [Actinobacteria bacterium]|nr:glycoside hydrolase family 88 protein [Actinomycetota bacterium]
MEDAVAAVLQRVEATAAESATGFPVHADPATGDWTRSEDGFWTGGFWAGLLWLAAEVSGDSRHRVQAVAWASRLRARADSDTVLRGVLFWYGAAIGDVLAGDAHARETALVGARGLARSYQSAALLIPLGNAFGESPDVARLETNIDGVPGGVPLLMWAHQRGGDSSLEAIARAHVARAVELFVRADGSVCQSASIAPETGEVLRRYTHKGLHADSTWARGQAWAMLGFAQATRWVDEFAEAALRVSDWWVDHLPESGVALWDFDDPTITRPVLDTSATAIAAAALLKLATLAPDRAERYRAAALAMTQALVSRHLTPVSPGDPRPCGMLLDGCYDRRTGRATQNELVWGDYFFFEALLTLTGRLDPVAL